MKSVFITGANRGLGYGFVEYLLSEGFMVFAGTRKITNTMPQHDNLTWIECDVTNDGSIDSAVEQVKSKVGSLTFLINNAGVNKDTIPEKNKDYVSTLGHLNRYQYYQSHNCHTEIPTSFKR
jgi:NAD(P)-dependent dehydrogenase (short-subunit alcohol dehydrogenase family)